CAIALHGDVRFSEPDDVSKAAGRMVGDILKRGRMATMKKKRTAGYAVLLWRRNGFWRFS
ncbi:MAG TPA: hypothetical protein VK815_06715, partial [Candidatus Acidoferrales bacterium]|nr:hypothetical protein [Candidatus Acidoferrales bacterium]